MLKNTKRDFHDDIRSKGGMFFSLIVVITRTQFGCFLKADENLGMLYLFGYIQRIAFSIFYPLMCGKNPTFALKRGLSYENY